MYLPLSVLTAIFQTNTAYYRPDALPVTHQQCQSTEGKVLRIQTTDDTV